MGSILEVVDGNQTGLFTLALFFTWMCLRIVTLRIVTLTVLRVTQAHILKYQNWYGKYFGKVTKEAILNNFKFGTPTARRRIIEIYPVQFQVSPPVATGIFPVFVYNNIFFLRMF